MIEKIEKLMKEAGEIFFDLDPKNNFEMKGRNDYIFPTHISANL